MPEHRMPVQDPAASTADAAARYEWIPATLRSVDAALSFMGGFLYQPTEGERTQVRAWLTATDARIGLAEHATAQDPYAFLHVAREVAALADDALLGRYQERRREMEDARYAVRAVAQMAPAAAAQASETCYGAVPAHPERAEELRQMGAAFAHGRGFVRYDRLNHRYVPASWRPTAQETSADSEASRRRNLHDGTPSQGR